jgi:CHAD domain-containing protein
MNQRLQIDRTGFGLRRVQDILQRQIKGALATLRHSRGTDEGVHGARKQMKAARATLRLLRPALPERTFQRQNHLLRDAGRAIAPVRDQRMLERTLGEMLEGVGSRPPPTLERFAGQLHRQAQAARADALREGIHRSAAHLEKALSNSASWPSLPRDWKPVRRGLRRTYRQARRVAKSNARRATAESLHEWRKRSKDLRSQLEVIAPLQHASLEKMADKLHTLSDELGEEHDLAVLRQRLRQTAPAVKGTARERLEKRIAKGRTKARRKALRVGKQVYAERPRRFAARLRDYFRRWSE